MIYFKSPDHLKVKSQITSRSTNSLIPSLIPVFQAAVLVAYAGPCQTSRMKLYAQIPTKTPSYLLDSEYASLFTNYEELEIF